MRSFIGAFAFAAILIAACGDRSPLPASNASTADAAASDAAAIIQGTPCSIDATGSIPGVTISIHGDKCVFSVGEAATFTYVVTTDATVPPIVVGASSGCGSCRTYGDDPLGFTRFVISGTADDGQQEQYCLCDTGCCAPDQAATIQLTPKAGTATIDWPGKSWLGPSDTGNPLGAPFAPGKYDVIVTFDGGASGSVSAKLPIEVR